MDATCASDTLGSALVTIAGEPGREFVIYWRQFENGGVPFDEGMSDTVQAGAVRLIRYSCLTTKMLTISIMKFG